MLITNKYNLPEPVMTAIKKNKYKKKNCNYSVTELLQPPHLNYLKSKNEKDIKQDASDMIYALEGTILHKIYAGTKLSRFIQHYFINPFVNNKKYYEKNIYYRVGQDIIAGTPDYVELDKKKKIVEIFDYKKMTVWEYKNGIKEEKCEQLNLYAYYFLKKGYTVKGLELVCHFRDWSKTRTTIDRNYPPKGVMGIQAPIWKKLKTEYFLNSMIACQDLKPFTTDCTVDEKWVRGNEFAIIKKGVKRAKKVEETFIKALAWLNNSEFKNDKNVSIIYRPGVFVRCEHYCIVNEFCSGYKKYLEEKENSNAKR